MSVVCLYTSANFRGQPICVNDASSVARMVPSQDNRVSSLRVSPGWVLRVCQERDFGGWCRNFGGDIRRLRDSNDDISSFEVSRLLVVDPEPVPEPGGVACLFAEQDYRGEAICVAGEARVSRLQPWEDNRTSSFRVADGWHLRVCRDANFGGWCREFTGDEPRLRASNDQISSFEVSRIPIVEPEPPPPPPPPPPPSPAGVVCLYPDQDFRGVAICANDEARVANMRPWEDNRISSFRIAEGWKLLACRDPNFGGWCREFTSDESRLRASNDAISSFQVARITVVEPPPIRVACLFSEPNFGGLAVCSEGPERISNLGPRLNDTISSIRLVPGWSMTFCAQPNMGGVCARTDGDQPRLGPPFNNRISSYEVFQTVARPAPLPPPTPDPGILSPGPGGPVINLPGIIGAIAGEACLYEDRGFGGASVCGRAGTERRNLTPAQDNKISSLRVPSGLLVVACGQPNFGGVCRRYDSDTSFVGPAFNDRISSYRISPNF